MSDAFSNDLPAPSTARRVLTPKEELLGNGYSDKGEVKCSKCGEMIVKLESQAGRPAYFDPDGRMHNFTCGERYPSFELPPPPDQEAYLREHAEDKSVDHPASRDSKG